MAFDPSTAVPDTQRIQHEAPGGFDPSTAELYPSQYSRFMAKQNEPRAPFLADDPNKEYGTLLPFAKDKRTGAVEFAVPEFLRTPLRGAEIGGQVIRGERAQPTPGSPEWQDLFAATSFGAGLPPGSSLARGLPKAPVPVTPTTPAEVARQAGYVLPPGMISDSPGPVANSLAALGGKTKIAQEASVRNQGVTNRLASTELGLPENATLTESTFNTVRSKAAQAHKAVEGSGVPIKQDMQFVDDLLKLGPQSEEMAKYFPASAKNDLIKELQDEFGTGETFSPTAGIQAVRRLRSKATTNLKSFDNPDKVELGMAQRKAADAIDDLVERNLTAAGKPDLVNQYRAARQLIAKSHDLESATNTVTGNVDARVLARLADRGRPLSGNLKTIADVGAAFPKAVQNQASFGGTERFSVFDAITAAVSGSHLAAGALTGQPEVSLASAGILAGVLARPLARNAALSDYIQNRIMSLQSPRAPAPQNSLAALSSLARPAPALQGVNQLARLQQRGGFPQQQPILPIPGQQPQIPQSFSPDQGAR